MNFILIFHFNFSLKIGSAAGALAGAAAGEAAAPSGYQKCEHFI
jgi:hypothetical protein